MKTVKLIATIPETWSVEDCVLENPKHHGDGPYFYKVSELKELEVL